MTGDTALYVWGCYVVGVALVLTEIVLLRLRYRAIRGHLGLSHHEGPDAELRKVDAESPARDASP